MFSVPKQSAESKSSDPSLQVSFSDGKLRFEGSFDSIISFMEGLFGRCHLHSPWVKPSGKYTLIASNYIINHGNITDLTPELACNLIKILRAKELITEGAEKSFIKRINESVKDIDEPSVARSGRGYSR